MIKTINIIGAGRVGKTIGRLIVQNKLGKINAVCNCTLESAQQAVHFIGDGIAYHKIKQIPPADLTIITTPDDKICEIGIALCRTASINPGSIFIHCSGVHTSEIISALKLKNALIASIHPMKSFVNLEIAAETYPGTFCAIEGDIDALKIITPFFESFGSVIYSIAKEKKSLYHAAGVFASNYLVTLAQQAVNCLHEAGVNETISLNIVLSLMKGTLNNIETSMSLNDALTGPIKRGDISTIKSHLAAFSNNTIKSLYASLGTATIDLTSHNSTQDHDLEQRERWDQIRLILLNFIN